MDSAQQILAEVGPTAATFPSAGRAPLPEGQPADAALAQPGGHCRGESQRTLFELLFRCSGPRLGHPQTIGLIAHRLCRLIWLILHQGVRYEERGPALSQQSQRHRTARMIRQLRSLGYRVELASAQSAVVPA